MRPALIVLAVLSLAIVLGAVLGLLHGAQRPAKVSRRWRREQNMIAMRDTVEYPRWRSPREIDELDDYDEVS